MRTLNAPRHRRPTLEEVVADARRAVHSARAERDDIQRDLALLERERDDLFRENAQLRQALQTRPLPAPAPEPSEPALDLLSAAAPLLEVVDHLGRALASNPSPESPWFQGMAAVLARAKAGLSRLGLEPVGRIGERFDPHLHEAIGTLASEHFEPDTVMDVVDTGLRTLDGVLLRAARVVVAKES